MSDKKLLDYNLGRGLLQILNRGVPGGLEAELHAELTRNGELPNPTGLPALRVPFSVLAQSVRQLSATGAPGTGIDWLSHRDLLLGAEVLLTPSIIRQSGAQLVVNLRGDTVMPHVSALSAAPEFIPENGTAPEVDLTTAGTALLVPRRLSSTTIVSRQLLVQAQLIEMVITETLARVFSSIIDRAAILGTGINDQPRGVLAAPGSINFPIVAADPLYPQLVAMERLIEEERVDVASFGFVTSPRLREYLRTVEKFPGGGDDCWSSITNPRSSPQVDVNRIFFGSWTNCVIATWGPGFTILVDQFSRAGSAQVRLHCSLWADIGLRHGRAFGYSDVITPLSERAQTPKKK
jgi:hypothetical protein